MMWQIKRLLCTSCEVWSIYNAISFQNPEYVKNLIRENKVLIIAKKQLEEKYKNV